jgi:hypothetical protein
MVYRRSSVDDIVNFSATIGKNLKVLNKKTIQDWEGNPRARTVLFSLLWDIKKKGYGVDMYERQFIKGQNLFRTYSKSVGI